MHSEPQNLKAERVQGQFAAVTAERLQEERGNISEWQVQYVPLGTPSIISRHFPQESFSASAAFVTKAATQFEKYGRAAVVMVDATGVTVQLGKAPQSGVTETDLGIAADLNGLAG